MPQTPTGAPSQDQFGDRASGGLDPIKKTKKTPPSPTINPKQLQKKVDQQAETVATSTIGDEGRVISYSKSTPQTRRDVRERVINKHIAGYVHDQMDRELQKQLGDSYTSLQDDDQARLLAQVTPDYLEQLNQRAQRLTPGLMRKNPNLAAELLMSSSIPTHQLQTASEAALEAWQGTVGEWALRESNHAAGMNLPNAHDMIAGVRDTLKSPMMKRAATMAWNIHDPEQRAIYLNYLRYVHMHPELYDVSEFNTMGLVDKWYGQALDGALEASLPQAPAGLGEELTAGIGGIFAAPFKAVGWAGGTALRSYGLDSLAEMAGAGARFLEQQGGNAIHFAQGAALTALTTPISAWDISHGDMPRFLHGWGDPETVTTQVMTSGLEAIGENPDDWQGLIGFANLAEDTITAEILLKIPAEIKLARGSVYGRTGQAVVESGAGRTMVDKIWEDVQRSKGRVSRTAEHGEYDVSTARLIADRYKKMQPKMAEDLSHAATKDDVVRIITEYIDENPTSTMKALGKELRGINRELKRIGETNAPSPTHSLLQDIQSLDDQLGRLADQGIESGPEVDALIARGRELEAQVLGPQQEVVTGTAGASKPDLYQGTGRVVSEEDLAAAKAKWQDLGERANDAQRAVEGVKSDGMTHEGVPLEQAKKTVAALDRATEDAYNAYAALRDGADAGRFKAGDPRWDDLQHMSADEASAKTYGPDVKGYSIKPEAKVLEEGSAEYNALKARGFDPSSATAKQFGNFVDKAKAAGYDVIKWSDQDAIGTTILNPESIVDFKAGPPAPTTGIGRGGPSAELIEIDKRLSELEQSGNSVGPEYDALMERGKQLADEMGLTQTVEEGTLATAESLEARAVEIKAHMEQLRWREPVWELPKRSSMQSFMRGVPSSNRVRGFLQGIFAESGKLDVSKMFNDFSVHDRTLYSPINKASNPYNWASHNVEAINKVLSQAKVPAEEIRGLIAEMYKLRSDQDFFRWEGDIYRAAERGVLKQGKRTSAYIPGFHDRIFRQSERSLEERISSPVTETVTLPDGRTVSEVQNSLQTKGGGEPLPSRPEHFRNQGQVPDISLVQEAGSSIRYFDNWAKQNPWLGKASIGDHSLYGGLRATARLTKFVALDLPRMIMKPMMLVARIIPMGTKIFVDESMRQYLMGYTRGIWRKNGVDYSLSGLPENVTTKQILGQMGDKLGGPDSALGTIAESEVMNGEFIHQRVNTRNATINDQALVSDARAAQIVDLAKSPFMQKFAAYGPDGMLQYLELHPETRLGTWYAEQMKPFLAEKGITPEEWLAGQERELSQATGGIEGIRHGIATGEWEVGRPIDTGATIERQHILDEMEIARSERALREDGVVRREWSVRMTRLEHDLERIDRSIKLTGRETLKMGDKEALANEIMKEWQDNHYKMPDEVIVKRRAVEDAQLRSRMSKADRFREQAGKLSGVLYKGLRPLSRYDFARRNTYRAVLDETYTDLIRRGYSPDLALEIAHIRSAGITKDLHYDLTARSSFDRKMKDLFWFSPVWREQVSTWLYKIPSRSYWPVGMVLRAHELYSIMDAFTDIGLLERIPGEKFTDPSTGKVTTIDSKLVMNVPWVTDFIQKAFNNSEVGQMNVEGFNPATPGTSGLLPTIAPGMESILDFTASRAPKSMQPFFQATADLFTFDQDPTKGPNYFPTAFIAIAETMGINIPFDTLNMDDWREAENKTNLQSLRWAASDLAADGVLPPEYPGMGEELQNSEKYQKWFEEKQAYDRKLQAHSHDYYWGVGMLHVIGSVVTAGQFSRPSGMTDEGSAYYDFMSPLYDARDAGTLSKDDFYAQQNQYISEHPEAWIYSVGQHPGTYGTKTYDTSAYLDAKTYTEKALKSTHYWMEVDPNDPSVPEGEKEAIAQKQTERNVIARAANPTILPNDLENLGALGLDQSLAPIVEEVTHIYHATDQRSVGKDDAHKIAAYQWRDTQLRRIEQKYGEDGATVLRYYQRTPAQRLVDNGYFHSKSSNLTVQDAQQLISYSHSNSDSDFVGAAVENGVLDRKISMYQRIENMRASNPAFDRELRRAEETLGEKDTTKGRVALYEWIYFGNQDNLFGYQDAIVKGLNG